MANPATTPEQLVSQARDALAGGDWDTARRSFEAALEQRETPEALEGLATAAFFLDESEQALDARERAYAAYRAAGRPVDAARVAIALAWDYRAVRGERAVADGWLGRARRLLEGRAPTREQGWLALREASFALPGDAALARERSAEAEALGRDLDDVDLEMTALALDGLARVSQGEIADGMARLDEATTAATAGEMRDPIAIGLSCCYLIFACERVRDFERAGQWCQRVARMAEGWNIRALRSVCRAHYGTVLMLRGDWAGAEVVLSEAAAALAARPGEANDALARLAELRRRQGATEKALALIAQLEHYPVAVLCRAAIALERGDPTAAADGATRYLRQIGAAKTERAPGLELLAEAQAAAGKSADAAATARELRAVATAAGTDPLLGAARQAEGYAHAAGASLEEAREAFEDAVQLLGRAGLPYETARARIALARTLRALGREDDAGRELELALERFAALGAVAEERRAEAATPPGGPATDGGAALTARESEILGLVAEGLSNRQIAARLTLSEHTVHRHVANILVKLGVSSRAAAAALAAKHGLTG
jgi:LuxR family maltose regulon positive regulatory protein